VGDGRPSGRLPPPSADPYRTSTATCRTTILSRPCRRGRTTRTMPCAPRRHPARSAMATNRPSSVFMRATSVIHRRCCPNRTRRRQSPPRRLCVPSRCRAGSRDRNRMERSKTARRSRRTMCTRARARTDVRRRTGRNTLGEHGRSHEHLADIRRGARWPRIGAVAPAVDIGQTPQEPESNTHAPISSAHALCSEQASSGQSRSESHGTEQKSASEPSNDMHSSPGSQGCWSSHGSKYPSGAWSVPRAPRKQPERSAMTLDSTSRLIMVLSFPCLHPMLSSRRRCRSEGRSAQASDRAAEAGCRT
jgi:hypothetical protein